MTMMTILQVLTTNESLSLFTVFFAGLVAFFSPCVLPIVPLYVGYLSGNANYIYDGEEGIAADELRASKRRTLINTLAFVLGISFVYLALALAASSMGQFLQVHGKTIQKIGGILVLILGLGQLLSKLVGFNLGRERRLNLNLDKYSMNPLVAFILGFTFSFAWTPCIGPILLSVIAMVANAGTLGKGLGLMLVYILAFTIPFMLVGIFTTQLLTFFRTKRKFMQYAVIIGAVLMILMGLVMIFDLQSIFHI